jgi:hypothetical protein
MTFPSDPIDELRNTISMLEEVNDDLKEICDERLAVIRGLETACNERLALIQRLQTEIDRLQATRPSA